MAAVYSWVLRQVPPEMVPQRDFDNTGLQPPERPKSHIFDFKHGWALTTHIPLALGTALWLALQFLMSCVVLIVLCAVRG